MMVSSSSATNRFQVHPSLSTTLLQYNLRTNRMHTAHTADGPNEWPALDWNVISKRFQAVLVDTYAFIASASFPPRLLPPQSIRVDRWAKQILIKALPHSTRLSTASGWDTMATPPTPSAGNLAKALGQLVHVSTEGAAAQQSLHMFWTCIRSTGDHYQALPSTAV